MPVSNSQSSRNAHHVSCPVCGTSCGAYRREVDKNYSIYKCARCGLEYTEPVPSESCLRDYYSAYRDPRAERKVVEQNAHRHLELLSEYGWSKEEPTLDFGCGDGAFVSVAGDNCFGFELQAKEENRIFSNFSDFPYRQWRFVTMWGVLEHLPDPVSTLRDIASLQAPGGVLALTTVDAEGIIPYYYKPPEHLTYWTRASLEVLAEKSGYGLVDLHPYHMVQLSEVYMDRLLSRTPEQYRKMIHDTLSSFVLVPTNEFRAVLERV